jgi:hypothetical protein
LVLLAVPALAAPGSLEPTKTVLAPLPSQTSGGKPLALAATVTGSGTPAGEVTFMDGDTPLATVALDASGTARTEVALGDGRHAIKAVYSGSAMYAPGASAPVPTLVFIPVPTLDKTALALLAAALAGVALWSVTRSSMA